jgi:hypothetical protein
VLGKRAGRGTQAIPASKLSMIPDKHSDRCRTHPRPLKVPASFLLHFQLSSQPNGGAMRFSSTTWPGESSVDTAVGSRCTLVGGLSGDTALRAARRSSLPRALARSANAGARAPGPCAKAAEGCRWYVACLWALPCTQPSFSSPPRARGLPTASSAVEACLYRRRKQHRDPRASASREAQIMRRSAAL